MDPVAFPGQFPSWMFWTASLEPGPSPTERFAVRFDAGKVIESQNPLNSNAVRCVRRPRRADRTRYSVSNDVVLDTWTGLSWQRTAPVTPIRWMDALAYCEGLSLGGQTDWRVPNAKELFTLFDRTVGGLLRMDPIAFPNTDPARHEFWSASPVYNTHGTTWVMGFQGGGIGNPVQTNGLNVRCVR